MSEILAMFGGPRTINARFTRYNPIGPEEVAAATEVISSGNLSPFLGSWEVDTEFGSFYGGPKVREFEDCWSDYFKVQHSVSVNSCTSGLMVALGAIGIEPGDEVIVSTWTMCASATAILIWNAIPVFADIEDETFNLDPLSVEKNITPYTKAIVVTNIFGHGAKLNEIKSIAKKHKLRIIEDNAQAPGALFDGQYTGTIGDIGVFSLNYHKHIHTGEGGMCVTNDNELAERMQLIRNHAEAVVEGKGVKNLTNMIGFNFRMGEIEAAIGIEQLKKLPAFIAEKVELAETISKGLEGLVGLRTPFVEKKCTHVYYAYPLLLNEDLTGVSRENIFNALTAEGVPALADRYVNLHLYPMYQKKIAYGSSGFPWTAEFYKGDVVYEKGICSVAESMNDKKFLNIGLGLIKLDHAKCRNIVTAFKKVWNNLDELRDK